MLPSYEYAIVLFVPEPTATHSVPFHAILLPEIEKTELVTELQVIPSYEYAIFFVPVSLPTATHRVPFHATLLPSV